MDRSVLCVYWIDRLLALLRGTFLRRCEPLMTWKRFQRAVWVLLAVCAGGMFLLWMIGRMGFLLVIGPVDSGVIIKVLLVIFLLTLMVWGDKVISRSTEGWTKKISLTAAHVVEGLFMTMTLFAMLFTYCSPRYTLFPSPDGESILVVQEENWLLAGWGRFYWQVCPGLLRDTGVDYSTDDGFRPFEFEAYELEWEEDQVIIHYNYGNGYGIWKTCIVPLD